METGTFSAREYEKKYRKGFGLVYPESHIIRVHRQILEWELGIVSGNLLDFGCGSGAHVKYFADHGFVPYGCDTSGTAIEQVSRLLPTYASHFRVSTVIPDLAALFGGVTFQVFLSNQVLYYLDDDGIRRIVRDANALLQPGGVFIASMMAYTCWYARSIVGSSGDFKQIQLASPRQSEVMFLNLKHREEIEPLFQPFKKLHLGSYGWHIREEEGPHDHWLYVGVKA